MVYEYNDILSCSYTTIINIILIFIRAWLCSSFACEDASVEIASMVRGSVARVHIFQLFCFFSFAIHLCVIARIRNKYL